MDKWSIEIDIPNGCEHILIRELDEDRAYVRYYYPGGPEYWGEDEVRVKREKVTFEKANITGRVNDG